MVTIMQPRSRLLPRKDVESLTGLSSTTIYRLMRQGEFPLPIRIGQRAVRWPAHELDKWLATRPRAEGEHGTGG